MASVWKTKASISMPVPATNQAIRAPYTPVSCANRRGSEKTPAPTIEPTTIDVIVSRLSFAVCGIASVWVVSFVVMSFLPARSSQS
jgi:hypothetical protein